MKIQGINNFKMLDKEGKLSASFEARVLKDGKGYMENMVVEVNEEILELTNKLQSAVIKAKEGE